MDIIVFGLQVVVVGGGSQVAVLIDVYLEAIRDQGPLAHIELSLVVKIGFFDVFLKDPRACGDGL